MYETIYYSVVEYGDILHSNKKERLYILRQHWTSFFLKINVIRRLLMQ